MRFPPAKGWYDHDGVYDTWVAVLYPDYPNAIAKACQQFATEQAAKDWLIANGVANPRHAGMVDR